MSQFWAGLSAGGLPPTVPTSFQTDSGVAVPVADVLNIFGGSNIGTTGSGNTVTINFSYDCNQSITTTDATPTVITCFNLGSTPAVFTFSMRIAAFAPALGKGAGYTTSTAARTDGVTATLISIAELDPFEDAAFAPADAVLGVSGNNIIVTVTGLAGTTINWHEQTLFTKVT
jgi:hypothetical protein